ncbi:MAG: C25 family cysteine peptidase [Candidatus Cloacimonetes bacterium]|nr:C25 family cysteine peptidase [Candidatus Cloacimonadota bacterium]
MKKTFLLIMVLLTMKCLMAETLTLLRNYQQDDYNIEILADSTAVIHAVNPDFTYSNEVGAPSLPYDTIWIAVPPNSTFNNISYNILSQEAIGVYDVFPTQQAKAISDTSSVEMINRNDSSYYLMNQYPTDNCTYANCTQYGNISLLCVMVCPFVYSPQTGALELITNISMNIDYTQTENYGTLLPNQGEFIQSIVVNPGDVLIDYDQARYSHGDIKYLIVTSDALAPIFESLAQWKSQQGIPAKVVTTQEIYSNPLYAGSDNQEKIKNCIKAYVDTKGTEYVLLGGAHLHVPNKIVHIPDATHGYWYLPRTMVTDYYYACLDDESWYTSNLNHNHNWAQRVNVGRVACLTYQQASNFIDKLKHYEKYEGYPNEFSNGLLLGGSRTQLILNDVNDASIWLHRINDNYISNHNHNFDYKYYLDGDDDFSYEQNPLSTGLVVSEGYNLTMWLSHGTKDKLCKLDASPTFNYTTVSSLSNQFSQGLMYSMACLVANYENGYCLGESLIEAPNGGYIGFIGHSSRNWGPSSTKQLILGLLVGAKFMYKLTKHNNSSYGKVADALQYARQNAINNIIKKTSLSYDEQRWNRQMIEVLLGLTYLGDPSLKVWTSTPSSYSIGQLPSYIIKNEETSINVSGFDVASTLCVSNGDDIYEIYNPNSNQVITLTLNPTTDSPIILTVTGQNKIPYQAEIPVYTRVISGVVLLEDTSTNVSEIRVDLIYPDGFDPEGFFYQTTYPNASGEYQFQVRCGSYQVKYSLFDLDSGLAYYPYYSPTLTMDENVPDLHISVPARTLNRMTLNQLIVTNNQEIPGFADFREAISYAQSIIYSPEFSHNRLYLNLMSGDYYLPYNGGGIGGFSVSSNNAGGIKSLLIRGVQTETSRICLNTSTRFLNITTNNIALEFQNVHFYQGYTVVTVVYNMQSTGDGSFKFRNCVFGRVNQSEQKQNRTHVFIDSSHILFDNCNFSGCQASKGNFGVLKFDNCENIEIQNSQFDKCYAQFGGAIHIRDSNNVTIVGCTFRENYSIDNNYGSISDGTEGGAIYIFNSQNIDVENNVFVNNLASGGGGPLFLEICSMFSIIGNMFRYNHNDHLGLDFEGSYSFTLDYCQIDEAKKISNNIIIAVRDPIATSHAILIGNYNTGDLRIQNCVFDIQHPQGYSGYNHEFHSYSDINVSFDNCVFDTKNEAARFVAPPNSTITVSNSLFSNVPQGVTSLLNSHCNIDDMGLDENYRPIWNTTMKSPCIDNGNPDTNGDGETWQTDHGDRDADGTQMDIGAIPLIDGHIHRCLRLTKDKVKYISIPGVVNYPGSGEQNSLLYVFDEFRNNGLFTTELPVLGEIRWMYNEDEYNASPTDIPEHYVCSQNGYKVSLTENAPDVLIQYQGYFPNNPMNKGMFIPGIDRYTPNHYILPPGANSPVDSNTGIPYREIYLGYYLSESLKPFDAINPILNDITAIYAEDWAMARLPVFGYSPTPGDEPSDAYTDNWLGCFPIGGKEITINPGEMVVVRYIGNEPIEFKLGGDNPDPPFIDPFYREMTAHFDYIEQPEYIPIFLSIDLNQFEDGNKPLEVAVFVDEECKGAAVVKDGEVQLNAYITNITDPTEELKNLEFRMYFPSKANNANVLEYSVLNNQSGRFESRNVSVSECKEFLQVMIGKTEEPPLPSVTKLFGNYPNPFNPETTISFDLAVQSPVTIEVFNIKGQKVKTLVSNSYAPGHHSVVWNGSDAKGRTVSTGVYFYRMVTPTNTLNHKMLLMK